MAYITHKFGKTFYQKKGKKKSGIPLIALHGGPGGMCLKMTALYDLSDEREVFLYDQIGGGRSSEIPQSKQEIETFVEELDILIKSWGIKELGSSGLGTLDG